MKKSDKSEDFVCQTLKCYLDQGGNIFMLDRDEKMQPGFFDFPNFVQGLVLLVRRLFLAREFSKTHRVGFRQGCDTREAEDKFQLISACLFKDEYYITAWLFIRQVFIAVSFISQDSAATVLTVGKKALSYQTNNKTTEIKEAIHVILTFPLHSDICFLILLWMSWIRITGVSYLSFFTIFCA